MRSAEQGSTGRDSPGETLGRRIRETGDEVCWAGLYWQGFTGGDSREEDQGDRWWGQQQGSTGRDSPGETLGRRIREVMVMRSAEQGSTGRDSPGETLGRRIREAMVMRSAEQGSTGRDSPGETLGRRIREAMVMRSAEQGSTGRDSLGETLGRRIRETGDEVCWAGLYWQGLTGGDSREEDQGGRWWGLQSRALLAGTHRGRL